MLKPSVSGLKLLKPSFSELPATEQIDAPSNGERSSRDTLVSAIADVSLEQPTDFSLKRDSLSSDEDIVANGSVRSWAQKKGKHS